MGRPYAPDRSDLPPADDVRITDIAPVIRAAGNGVELAQMRWSWKGSGGKQVFNFCSEERRFGDSNRCLIPATAFFEFTGTKSPKTKHRCTLKDSPFLCISGIWREGDEKNPPAFTILTTAPGPDIAPYHNRQVVVLRPGGLAELDLSDQG